jgi:hypothetical protein
MALRPDPASQQTFAPQEELPATPRRERPPAAPFGPGKRFLAERQVSLICIVIALASAFLALHYSVRAAEAAKSRAWVVLLDDSGAYTIAPAVGQDPKARIFQDICVQAAELALRRNPSGLSFPEFAEKFFTGFSPEVLKTNLMAERDERVRRNLFDMPEVEKVEKLDENSRELAYRVSGKIIRSGALEGIALREVGEFRMFVLLEPQPDLSIRGRYPFVCSKWGLRVRWDDGSTEEWTATTKQPRTVLREQGGAR